MKKIAITFSFLIIANLLSAQLGISLNGSISTPGYLLNKSTYPALGGGGGMGLLYRINSPILSVDAGIDAQFLMMGRKVYKFDNERDEFYNSSINGNLFARLIFNKYDWKPYIGVFTGATGTNVTEKFYVAGAHESDKTELTLTKNNFQNNGISFGLFYELDPFVQFEIGASYNRGLAGVSYFDFSSAQKDADHVYYQIDHFNQYDMWTFKLGFVFFLDWENCTTSTGVSSIGGGIFNMPRSPGTATSHGRPSPHLGGGIKK